MFAIFSATFVERGSGLKEIPAGQEMYSKKNCPHLHPASPMKKSKENALLPSPHATLRDPKNQRLLWVSFSPEIHPNLTGSY